MFIVWLLVHPIDRGASSSVRRRSSTRNSDLIWRFGRLWPCIISAIAGILGDIRFRDLFQGAVGETCLDRIDQGIFYRSPNEHKVVKGVVCDLDMNIV